MDENEYLVSPDGNSIAIRSIWPIDGSMAYGVVSKFNAGSWATAAQVADWLKLTEVEPE